MTFRSGYNFVEVDATNLRRPQDSRAVKLPPHCVGFLDLLRAFNTGQHTSWEYDAAWTVLGVEQFLLRSTDPVEAARHVHDDVLYDASVYSALAKLDASLVFACDGEFRVGSNTFGLRVGKVLLPLGTMFVGQPQILSAGGASIGYWAPFKLSG
jgi:hypothetical protein